MDLSAPTLEEFISRIARKTHARMNELYKGRQVVNFREEQNLTIETIELSRSNNTAWQGEPPLIIKN